MTWQRVRIRILAHPTLLVDFYYDRKGRWLYVCPIPMICLAVPL